MRAAVSMWVWVIGSLIIGMFLFTVSYSYMTKGSLEIQEQEANSEYQTLLSKVGFVCNNIEGYHLAHKITVPHVVTAIYASQTNANAPDNVNDKLGTDSETGYYICIQTGDSWDCKKSNCEIEMVYLGPNAKQNLMSLVNQILQKTPADVYELLITKSSGKVVVSLS